MPKLRDGHQSAKRKIPVRDAFLPDLTAAASCRPPTKHWPGQTCPCPSTTARRSHNPPGRANDRTTVSRHAKLRALEIGTGSGYQTAILAQLFAEVSQRRDQSPPGRKAEARLAQLGISSVFLHVADGALLTAPYDRILATVAFPGERMPCSPSSTSKALPRPGRTRRPSTTAGALPQAGHPYSARNTHTWCAILSLRQTPTNLTAIDLPHQQSLYKCPTQTTKRAQTLRPAAPKHRPTHILPCSEPQHGSRRSPRRIARQSDARKEQHLRQPETPIPQPPCSSRAGSIHKPDTPHAIQLPPTKPARWNLRLARPLTDLPHAALHTQLFHLGQRARSPPAFALGPRDLAPHPPPSDCRWEAGEPSAAACTAPDPADKEPTERHRSQPRQQAWRAPLNPLLMTTLTCAQKATPPRQQPEQNQSPQTATSNALYG